MDRVKNFFVGAGTHLTWHRLPDDHVIGASTGQEIASNDAYFVVRLSEMYLGRSRTLWRKFYPLVHAFTTHNGAEEHEIAGPGQLRELGESNLDRVISLNTRMAGPTAFKGGDVDILVGLYSVPGDDAARALISTVGAIADLPGINQQPVAQILDLFKTSVDSLLGLSETRIRLGVRDSFFQNNPLRAGFHVGIGASVNNVPLDTLWIKDGHLLTGPNPVVATPYSDYDYMVVEVERREHRDDWPRVPGLAEFDQQFSSTLGDATSTAAEKREALKALWPRFTEALATSPHLTRRDAAFISDSVSKDLLVRLEAIAGANPFETRSWAADVSSTQDPTRFSLAEVPDYSDPRGPQSDAALVGNPF